MFASTIKPMTTVNTQAVLSFREYIVKAYMKEYMFEPSSKMVKLDSGSVEELIIVGRKVAFSIFGKV